jgi:hypothetical protein
MLSLETDAAPLIVLRFHQPYAEGDEAAYLEALEAISARDESFALLTIFGGGPGLSPAGDRAQALWFKRTRAFMDQHCRALAMVRPGASEEMAKLFQKLWSFPVMATTVEAEARSFLARHLEASS